MVTANEFDNLRELQDILSNKIKLEKEILELPHEAGVKESTLTKMKEDFIKKNQDYEKMRVEETELRRFLAEAEAAREKAERTISEINTQREYEALDKERRTAEEKESKYRKELQEKEKNILEMDDWLLSRTELIKQNEDELAQSRSEIEDKIAGKSKELDALHKKEKKLTEGLYPEVVFKFERIIRNKEGVGIVAIKGNVCMGCHMILPAQFANNVRLGEEFIFCPYCSRILYYEESAEGDEMLFNEDEAGSLADLDDMEDDDEGEEEEEEEKANAEFEE